MRRVRCIDCGRISQRDPDPQELRRLERGAKLVCSDANCRGDVVFFLSETGKTNALKPLQTFCVCFAIQTIIPIGQGPLADPTYGMRSLSASGIRKPANACAVHYVGGLMGA